MIDEHSVAERIAALEVKHDVMREDISDIKQHVRQLSALANKGRGSLTAILWVGGFITAAVGMIGSVFGFMYGGHK